MSTAHTPGPWKACRSHEDFDGPMWEVDADTVECFSRKPFVRIEAASGAVAAAHDLFEFKQADAMLIEAAPDLLAALSELLADKYLSDPINAERMAKAREAVAKATRSAP